jgi:hypothetical protein
MECVFFAGHRNQMAPIVIQLADQYIHWCRTTDDGGVMTIRGVPTLVGLLDDQRGECSRTTLHWSMFKVGGRPIPESCSAW